MGNLSCVERDKSTSVGLGKNSGAKQILDFENKIENERKEVNLIPRKRDFFNFYKFVHAKRKDEKHSLDMQYFNIRRAKAVNSKKQKTYLIKECRKFHLNKVIRQLTMNEVNFVNTIVSLMSCYLV